MIFIERNKHIPGVVRVLVLYVICIRMGNDRYGMGLFGCLPKDVVVMIAKKVWVTRGHGEWLDVVE